MHCPVSVQADSKGHSEMHYPDFLDAMFELADLWWVLCVCERVGVCVCVCAHFLRAHDFFGAMLVYMWWAQ